MSKIWKVFVPHRLFGEDSSYLFGEVSLQTHTVFITATTTNASTANQLSEHINLVGLWEELVDGIRVTSKQVVWIKLFHGRNREINFLFQANGMHKKCTLVIYDAESLLKSAILDEKNKMGANDNLTMVYRTLSSTNEIVPEGNGDDVTLYGGKREESKSAVRKLLQYIPYVTWLLYLPFWLIKLENR